MSDQSDDEKKLTSLQSKIDMLVLENEELREELHETTQGTLALYSDIDNKNAELSSQQAELAQKNDELGKALKELEELQEVKLKAAKTNAMGTMVITYNHEINNPLSIILNSIQVLKMKNDKFDFLNEETLEYLTKVEKAAERIRDVVSKIREYENLIPVEYIEGSSMLDLHSGSPESKD